MKRKTSYRFLAIVLVVTMIMGLTACNGNSDNNTKKETESTVANPKDTISELTLVLTKEDMSLLNEYPNLKKLDATGSTCYDELLQYATSNPAVEVIYSVPLGGETTAVSTSTELSLTDGSYDFETLKTNLKYFPKLATLKLDNSSLTEAQVSELKTAYNSLTVNYTAAEKPTTPSLPTYTPTVKPNTGSSSATDTKITVDSSWPVHDWTSVDSSQMTTALENAKALAGNCVVKLNSSLTKAEVKSLQAAAPTVIFDYSFDFYGKKLSTLSKTVAYVNKSIGNGAEQEIKDVLSILTKCTYFKLDNCGLSNETMARIRDAYPGKSIVWRVYQKTPNTTRSWLTDTEVLRAVYHVDSASDDAFKYLTKVKYTDLGHNTNMKDISFLSYMPNLEIAILSGSPITDLSPLKNLKKLEFLELAWCGHLTDISPLAGCTNLKYLNLGHTKVRNFDSLKNLPLAQLSYVASGARVGMTAADWAVIQKQHPNCWITYNPLNDTDASPYSVGWRYKAEGGYTPCYRKVRDVFDLDAIDKILQGKN